MKNGGRQSGETPASQWQTRDTDSKRDSPAKAVHSLLPHTGGCRIPAKKSEKWQWRKKAGGYRWIQQKGSKTREKPYLGSEQKQKKKVYAGVLWGGRVRSLRKNGMRFGKKPQTSQRKLKG